MHKKNQNFNSVFTWIFTKVMKTCEQGALSREAEWAHAPHQLAAPLPNAPITPVRALVPIWDFVQIVRQRP